MALLLLSALESMATPCSVNALGSFLVPPQLDVPKWNFKFETSSFINTGSGRRFSVNGGHTSPLQT
jgi:hypothetical protein